MRILPTLLILALSAISINSFADAQTIVSIKKITTISGADADRFKNLFGNELSASNPAMTIQCTKKSCEITTTRSGFWASSPDICSMVAKRFRSSVTIKNSNFSVGKPKFLTATSAKKMPS